VSADDEHLWRYGGTEPVSRDPRDWVTGGEPVTPRQRKALLRLGYRDELPTMTKAAASAILRRELPTLGRLRQLPHRLPEDAR
jgi:hypothetical protein